MSRARNPTELALIEYFQTITPRTNQHSTEKIKEIESAINSSGEWTEQWEWRISTWLASKIKPELVSGRSLFRVTVECDLQQFTCLCSNIEKAFMFMSLYEHTIIYQFYSVGPPWA